MTGRTNARSAENMTFNTVLQVEQNDDVVQKTFSVQKGVVYVVCAGWYALDDRTINIVSGGEIIRSSLCTRFRDCKVLTIIVKATNTSLVVSTNRVGSYFSWRLM